MYVLHVIIFNAQAIDFLWVKERQSDRLSVGSVYTQQGAIKLCQASGSIHQGPSSLTPSGSIQSNRPGTPGTSGSIQSNRPGTLTLVSSLVESQSWHAEWMLLPCHGVSRTRETPMCTLSHKTVSRCRQVPSVYKYINMITWTRLNTGLWGKNLNLIFWRRNMKGQGEI